MCVWTKKYYKYGYVCIHSDKIVVRAVFFSFTSFTINIFFSSDIMIRHARFHFVGVEGIESGFRVELHARFYFELCMRKLKKRSLYGK